MSGFACSGDLELCIMKGLDEGICELPKGKRNGKREVNVGL